MVDERVRTGTFAYRSKSMNGYNLKMDGFIFGKKHLTVCVAALDSHLADDVDLLVAAPDLLSALKEIASIGDGTPDNIHESQIQRYSAGAIKIARDAVSKAEGRDV